MLFVASCINLMVGNTPEALPVLQQLKSEEVIRKSLKNARSHLPLPAGSGHLEHDIGEFLVQSIQVLEFLAESLTAGEHMTTNVERLLEEQDKENDLSESQSLDKLLEIHSALRKIRKRIQGTAKEVRLIWDKAKDDSLPKVPLIPSEIPTPQEEEVSTPTPKTEQRRRRSTLSCPDTEENANDRKRPRSDVVEAWGKASYTCTLGSNCQKGGVNPDGSLVVFERNSEYRSHMSKHAKPYRCNLPGCPNVKGFARQDQLKRHQSTVPHTVYHEEFRDLNLVY